MSYFFSGHFFGGSSGTVPSSPVVATSGTIRDRCIDLIEAITPSSLAGDKFRRYRNEGAANFRAWATGAGKANAWRRFQVRDTGKYGLPAVTNSDREGITLELEVVVAYPQTHRAGADAALDRDDVMREDQMLIESEIGVRGRLNFISPYPIASWTDADEIERESIDGVDFMVIRQRMYFYQSV